MPALRSADQEQLQKLLLGQLPSAEVERLSTEYADDSRLAELAESLAGQDDALLHLLHNHETAVVDPDSERLAERLVQRLKPALPVSPQDNTAAMNRADVSTEPSSPAATGPSQKLPERLEYYRPIKVLGQGGMGTVYLAEDTRLGREVAIKTLRPELAINPQAKERFLREARSAAKLEHDHIIPIYSVGEAADGTPFLAMPLLKGEPLDALIRRMAGPLPVAMVVRLAREMASGLGAAHARGLIHRDIKPANIWLEAPTGRVKILDFGLAKAADAGSEADSETNLTASGAIVGTPAYMAPEQASGHAVDGRADLFSLGCVLYELLAGKRAFSGPNTMSILMSLANHTPHAPDKLSPQCPAALSRLVMQLLEKDPAKRPASADAIIHALSELDIAPATTSDQASRAASAPRLSPNTAAVRGLTPPGSPTLMDRTQSDRDVPNDTILLSQVTPARKPSIPKRRIALALASVLLTLLAAVVYRIETNKGTVVVEINDDDVEAKLKSNGIEIRDSKSGRVFTIQKLGDLREASGDYKLADGKGLKFVVLDADGLELTTNEFKLVSGEKVRVRVTAETNGVASTTSPQSLATNPDRRAAEWVLSIGGTINVKENAQGREIKAVGDLPRGAFELEVVNLYENQKVSDLGLANFQTCKNLMQLELGGTQVTDSALAHFKQCKKLTSLGLVNSQVSDAGLAHFDGCLDITQLYLGYTKLSDVGLANFKDCKNLRLLHLGNTKVSDAGLAHFRYCQNLTHLDLRNTKVSNAGLAHFRDCQNLTSLQLYGPLIHDAGLAHFKDCKDLTLLDLHFTQVSDAGLAHFAGCPKLGSVKATKSKVTEAGVKKLSAALPGCKIEWDGGVIEPTVSPDRRAAEYVLSIGGTIRIKAAGQDREIKIIDDLPRVPFELTILELFHNSMVSDAGLVHFKDCQNLTGIHLGNTQVSDAGLAHFRDCQNLTHLVLPNTQVSDVGLALFKDCKNLQYLSLSGTKVTDAGLAHFKDCKDLMVLNVSLTRVGDAVLAHFQDCKKLTHLILFQTQVTDAGLAHFKDCKNLTALDLHDTQVSDAGLAHFKESKELQILNLPGTQVSDAGLEQLAKHPALAAVFLTKTKVTEAGVKKLSAALPGCKIEWDGGVIEPTVSPDRRAAEWVLSISGTIGIRQANLRKDITKSNDLPAGNLELFTVFLPSNTPAIDSDLSHLNGCKNLFLLELSGTPVTDAGLMHLKEVEGLEHLGLAETAVTDAGLIHLKDLKNLVALNLSTKGVTGSGLSHLAGCKRLSRLLLAGLNLSDAGVDGIKDCTGLGELNLFGASLTDAGLAKLTGLKLLTIVNFGETMLSDVGLVHLKEFKKLAFLSLAGVQITDQGLDHLADLKTLTALELNATQVTNEGLAHLKGLKNLKALNLTKTQVNDAGLIHLKDLKELEGVTLIDTRVTDASVDVIGGWSKLKHVRLQATKVTEAGVKKLSAALPGCKIEWDGGVIEPTVSPDRRAAEYVLSIGGAIQINGVPTKLTKASELQNEAFRLTYVDLLYNQKVTAEGLSIFQGCKNLTGLFVAATPINDDGLAHFKECKGLTVLNLDMTQVTDAGVEHFKGCDKLIMLGLTSTKVTEVGLAHFKNCKDLRHLSLGGMQVTDQRLAIFKDCENLEWLHVNHSLVSDAGLAELNGCKKLSVINLTETQVTDEALAILKDLKNLENLQLNGTQVTNTGLAHLKDSQRLFEIGLAGTKVTEVGLAHLKECRRLTQLGLDQTAISDDSVEVLRELFRLRWIFLKGTKVTETGMKKLSAALPGCKIEWDGGVIEPTVSTDR